MSVAGSTSSQGTRSRSPSRSRSPPYNDSRYRYSSRYDSYNYRPNRNGMSAALDDYRDLRDRERDRDRDRSMGILREDRYLSPRGRERDDRYTPYYRDDLASSHHYPPSSSSNPILRDYAKPPVNALRREGPDANKESMKASPSTSNMNKDLKEDSNKPPSSASTDPYPSNRYMDWRERDMEREYDRRYRERRDYDRHRDGYMRDMRYGSSSYGAPPPNYPKTPFGGDSYRPDRDRDPSPNMPYYERDRLDDRDFYSRRTPAGGNGGPSSSNNPDYDRYRGGGGRGRPNWSSGAKFSEDRSNRLLDRDRPEKINTTIPSSDAHIKSEKSSPTSAVTVQSSTSQKERDDKTEDAEIEQAEKEVSPSVEKSTANSPEPTTEGLETGEVVEEPILPTTTTTTTTTSSDLINEPEIKDKEQPTMTPQQEKVETKDEQDSGEHTTSREQGEVIEEEATVLPAMTQEEIVNRISDIENQISLNEELLEAALKREEESLEAALKREEESREEEVEMADDEDETAEDEAAQNKEEAKKQALQAMETDTDMMDFTEDHSSPIMRKQPQLLINQLRSRINEEDDKLYEKIIADNRKIAKANTNTEDGSDENESKPLYAKLEDYPCFKQNEEKSDKMRITIAQSLASRKLALKRKERDLKREYKSLYEQWKEKNIALDRIRDIERRGPDRSSNHRMSSRRAQEQQSEEYTDGVIFTANAIDALRFNSGGTSTPYGSNGLYTSDAARSEAELLEIIQSLESAEMRNPESRAKKTTATIPPMILDAGARTRTFDDRSGLVRDPLTYYHTGPDTGDVWNQEEVTTFMESYMMYPKQFERISIAIGTKTACQCVLFYYRKKKKIDFKALMKKGRRGKTTKHRDRIAAAIRLATGDSSSGGVRKTKSKGSALMADIGEAQNSRKAKEEDAERKSRELRNLEQANVYWDGVAERKKAKRPANNNTVSVPPLSNPIVQSGPPSSASDDTEMMMAQPTNEKRRTLSGSSIQKRPGKGRPPREPTVSETPFALPSTESSSSSSNNNLTNVKRYHEDNSMDNTTTGDEDDDKTSGATTVAKWSEREKELAIESFRLHGRDFVQVSGLIKTKTEEQCRNFYHNFKRKFGPNAFGEEDARQGISTTVTDDTKPTGIQQDVVAGRTDLKAEEEDAAAALVGMFQMGSNTVRDDASSSASRSRTPSSDIMLPSTSTVVPPSPSTQLVPTTSTSVPIVTLPLQQLQQKGRRRVRSASNKSDNTVEDTSEWTDSDYAAKSNQAGRKFGRTALLNDTKRPAYSSYWSVSEKNEFIRLLGVHGRDWDSLAKEMKSKTVIQVRNFYANNEEKMNLKSVIDRFELQKQQHHLPPQPRQQYDTSAAHFQALQNFPFPQPIADQQSPILMNNNKKPYSSPTVTPPPPAPPHSIQPTTNRVGFYSSPSKYNTNTTPPPPQPPQTFNTPAPQPPKSNRSLASIMDPVVPSAVTKVADLLNSDETAEPNQKSWETWFGS